MATEAPLIHDGAQCVAAANYSNGAGLAGPGGSGQFLAVLISAARTVAIDATGAQLCYGILQNKPTQGQVADVGIVVLQNKPTQGQVADVGIVGVSKAVAGAAFSAGALLMTDSSSRLITRTSTNPVVAVAIEAATAANQIVTVALVPSAY
jgi:hypothetical protein